MNNMLPIALFSLLVSCSEEKPPEVEFEQNSSQWSVIGELTWEAETIASDVDKAIEGDFRLFTQSGDTLWYSDPTMSIDHSMEDIHLQGVGIYNEPIFFTDEGVYIWEKDRNELSLSPLDEIWTDSLVAGHDDADGLWLVGTEGFYRWSEGSLDSISSSASITAIASGGNWVSSTGNYESRPALWLSANGVHAVVPTAAGLETVTSADVQATMLEIDRYDNVWVLDEEGFLHVRDQTWDVANFDAPVTNIKGHPNSEMLWIQVGNDTHIYKDGAVYTTETPPGDWLSMDAAGRLLTLENGVLTQVAIDRAAGIQGLPRQIIDESITVFLDPVSKPTSEISKVYFSINGVGGEVPGPPYEVDINLHTLSGLEQNLTVMVEYSDGSSSTTEYTRILSTPKDDDGDGYSEGLGDCNDADASIFPGAPEIANDGIDQDCDGEDAIDSDLDGWFATVDCDDNNAQIYPGAIEFCDEMDNDCDGEIDEEVETEFYLDSDGDGYGSTSSVLRCTAPEGYVDNFLDCDDSDSSIHPLANEICDFIDNDCDNLVDGADISLDTTTAIQYFADLDGDGNGDSSNYVYDCQMPVGHTLDSSDCDDEDPLQNQNDGDNDGVSSCAGDCDDTDASLNLDDGDGDGFSTCAGDCNDSDGTLNLDDSDADGYSTCTGDCNDADSTLNLDDVDGDGQSSCAGDCNDNDPFLSSFDNDGDGFSTCAGDCDDGNASLNPNDLDGDGFSSCGGDCDDTDVSLNLLDQDNDGVSTCDGDCNDTDASISTIDNDGDGFSACAGDCDDSDPTLNQTDFDGDGFSTCAGDCNDSDITLNQLDVDGDGFSSCDGDCDDTDASLNLLDQDNDGSSTCDNDCNDIDPSVSQADSDGDGYVTCPTETCVTIEMQDSYGDGWNGGHLIARVDGGGAGIFRAENTGSVETLCVTGSELEFEYFGGAWELENSYTIQDENGVELFSDGPYPMQGIVFTYNLDQFVDCDDEDPMTYPMAVEISNDGIDQDCDGADLMIGLDADGDGYEENVDCDDSNPDLNYDDADGDGYTSCPIETCYTLSMEDSYGDGWNGGVLSVSVNAVAYGDYSAVGSASSETFCVDVASSISLSYSSGSWEYENSYSLMDSTGLILFSDGPGPQTGEVFSTVAMEFVDCDDNDPMTYPMAVEISNDGIDQDCNGSDLQLDDLDQDGYDSSIDCDDTDASLNYDDSDGDMFYTCPLPESCYQIAMADSYGDGWNGGYVEIFADGVYQSTHSVSYQSGTEQIDFFCVPPNSQLDIQYTSGFWEMENTYSVFDFYGAVIHSDGPNPSEGTSYTGVSSVIIDCDDTSTVINPYVFDTPGDGIDQNCDGVD